MYNRQRSSRRGNSTDYVMPFLIIILVGVIIVLLFNLYKAIFGNDVAKGAYMHIVEGSVQMRTWNTEEFFDLSSDALILQGDEFKTSADAQVIVEFPEGTIMRVGGGSNVVLQTVDDDSKEPEINLLLVDGKVWFNKVYKETGSTNLNVKTANLLVQSGNSNIFEVEAEFDEVVRVLFGQEVVVDILGQEDKKAVERELIGVGQEIEFTDNVLQTYWQHQSPSVLAALSDEFKDSKWYEWNTLEDKNPTQFVRINASGGAEFIEVEPTVLETEVAEEEEGEEGATDEEEAVEEETEEPAAEEEAEPETEEEEPEAADFGPLTKPVILSVEGKTEVNADGFYVVEGRLATLRGSISGAEKVVVNGYTLQKFVPGSDSWSYFANADFGLMKVGENVYEVYALGPDGTRSESIFVKVLHDPQASAPVEDTSGINGTAPSEGETTEQPAE